MRKRLRLSLPNDVIPCKSLKASQSITTSYRRQLPFLKWIFRLMSEITLMDAVSCWCFCGRLKEKENFTRIHVLQVIAINYERNSCLLKETKTSYRHARCTLHCHAFGAKIFCCKMTLTLSTVIARSEPHQGTSPKSSYLPVVFCPNKCELSILPFPIHK